MVEHGIRLESMMSGRHSPYSTGQLHERCDCGTAPHGDWRLPRNHTFAEHEVFINLYNRRESPC